MTPEEIKKWARFAQLKISDDEIKQYGDINTILEFFAQLKEVDVSQIPSFSRISSAESDMDAAHQKEKKGIQAKACGHTCGHMDSSGQVQRLREDTPSDPSLHAEPMLYWVPAVFDEEA